MCGNRHLSEFRDSYILGLASVCASYPWNLVLTKGIEGIQNLVCLTARSTGPAAGSVLVFPTFPVKLNRSEKIPRGYALKIGGLRLESDSNMKKMVEAARRLFSSRVDALTPKSRRTPTDQGHPLFPSKLSGLRAPQSRRVRGSAHGSPQLPMVVGLRIRRFYGCFTSS